MAEYTCCSSVAFERPNEIRLHLHRSHAQIKLTPLEANRVKVALSAWRENYARSPSDFDLISAWARDDIGLVRLVPLPVWFTLPYLCSHRCGVRLFRYHPVLTFTTHAAAESLSVLLYNGGHVAIVCGAASVRCCVVWPRLGCCPSRWRMRGGCLRQRV